jgi:hypothetical protein
VKDEEKNGAGLFGAELEKQNFEVRPLLLAEQTAIPADAALLVLAGPEKEGEVRALLNGALGPGHVHGMDLWYDADRVVFGYAKAKPRSPSTCSRSASTAGDSASSPAASGATSIPPTCPAARSPSSPSGAAIRSSATSTTRTRPRPIST